MQPRDQVWAFRFSLLRVSGFGCLGLEFGSRFSDFQVGVVGTWVGFGLIEFRYFQGLGFVVLDCSANALGLLELQVGSVFRVPEGRWRCF